MVRPHKVKNFSLLLLVSLLSLVTPLVPCHTEQLKTEAHIVTVIDGDTIVAQIGAHREHVRLIGIDTPESKSNHRAEMQAHSRGIDQDTILALGNHAAQHTRSLLPKKSVVYLEFDVEKRDRYQRLLAYVWLPNGHMANEEIVRSGNAYILSVPPNIKYRERLAVAFRHARANKKGLWSMKNPHADHLNGSKMKRPSPGLPQRLSH